MRIDSAGRETVKWPYTADYAVTAVDILLAGTWTPATVTPADVRLLIAGPTATGNPAGTVVAPLGINAVKLRFVDLSEVIVRDGGVINIT